jgi:hypothetical protein
MEQEVLREIAVDERVAIDLEEIFQHPQAEDETRRERRGKAEHREHGGAQEQSAGVGGYRGTEPSIDSRTWLPYDS